MRPDAGKTVRRLKLPGKTVATSSEHGRPNLFQNSGR